MTRVRRRRFAAMPHTATGSQRRTFVLGPLAIKVPRLHRLRAGSRANREEKRIWREGWQRFYPGLPGPRLLAIRDRACHAGCRNHVGQTIRVVQGKR
jgi:hypothetical protein